MEAHQLQSDHDLLIELRTEMKGLREDLRTLSDGIAKKVDDHETRLRSVEKATENLMTKMIFGISIFSFVMAIISGLIIAWLKKVIGS